MNLSEYTSALLSDIEGRIVPEVEDDYIDQWNRFWRGSSDDIIFSPMRKNVSESGIEIKNIHINDALNDYELMLDMQLANVSNELKRGKNALSIRANYGTGIITSLFGAKIFEMPRSQNTLPTTRSFNDSDIIREIVGRGVPSIHKGFGKKVFEFGEICLEVFKNYPKISKYVYMYHPDTQGPLDIAELLWGSEMFYAMYDDPDLVHTAMRLFTDTYVSFLDKWFEMYPNRAELNAHWGILMRGNICLRDDSAMNLSPDLYEEYALRYDKYLLERYNGGIVHFCGRGDHYVHLLTASPHLTGINLSQPHLNDMEKIYASAFGNGKKILGLEAGACHDYEGTVDPIRSMIHKS